jgi:hypothetical protein
MNEISRSIEQESRDILEKWLASCIRGGKLSRNTIAVGLVVFDHLREICPVTRDDVISSGGEIKGARSGLGDVLEKYGIPRIYLKEATTRQVHQDGQRLFEMFEWGRKLCPLPEQDRDSLLLELAHSLSEKALEWLKRQNLKLDIDRRQAPTTWIQMIVDNAKSRSGGVVEQHLIGAKLERRYKGKTIPNHPAHAADVQTSRDGDFTIANNVYHVTASPSSNVVQKCAANLQAGKHPILLVPKEKVEKAKALAEIEEIYKELTIISIEDFIALNIIELATEEDKDFFVVLQEVVQIYNKRLAEVETDLSLQIEVR